MAKSNTTEFVFPSYFNLPPFFTLQPVLNTRQKQLQMWNDLILGFMRHTKAYELDVSEAAASAHPLFHNDKINRRLKPDTIRTIFEYIVSQGHGEWLDKGKSRLLILWRTPEEWGSLLYKWISDNGQTDTVLTVWELLNGDNAVGQDWQGLDSRIMVKALGTLEKQGKAEVFSAGSDQNLGVKFFST